MRLLICDMAGTIVNEKGLVYKTMLQTLKKIGINKELSWWQGMDKREAIIETINCFYKGDDREKLRYELCEKFEKNLELAYFSKDSNISLMDDNIPDYFNKLRQQDFKVALNTGYNRKIQKHIIDKLDLHHCIDDYISSQDVYKGRPNPSMIYELMRRNNITSSNNVIKAGDTKNDILEGINAKCGLTIGVLSGSGGRNDLLAANHIVNKITDFDLL